MTLLLNISEIAIITGDNPYKTKRDYLIDFWKKNNKNDYDNYINLIGFVKENDEDIVKRISCKNNIQLSTDILGCIKSKNTCELNKMKKDILKKVDNISEIEKKEITKSIINITNTNFGIKNENDISKIYESITGNKIIKDDKYRKIKIFSYNNFDIYIGGKIDGINENTKCIIEIKNRIHKLFYSLRDYEKVQIMSYIYLFNSSKGHLVEAHKKKDETNINIIEVEYDEQFMKYIIHKIYIFIKFYYSFINDNDMKINLLKNDNNIDFN
jgi:hypothetical protein